MSGTDKEIILSAKQVTHKYISRSGLFKRFEHTALDNVSFDICRGENLGILGRNGCGKSSLLRILAGIINPTQGGVGCKKDVSRALLSLGLGFRLDLSGRDNVLLSSMIGGMTKRKAIGILDDINEFAELGEFFDQPIKTYSAGMRSRLGFASALLTDVDIILIDELLSVGDSHFRNKALEAMKNRMKGRQTVIFVSHNPQQVGRICGRVLWIEGGMIQMDGDTKEVVQAYSRFMQGLNGAASDLPLLAKDSKSEARKLPVG